MPRALIRNINLGFGFALLVLLLIGVVSFLSLRSLVQSSERVTRMREVLARSSHIDALLSDAETSQRGFLITGDPVYLEAYESAAASLPGEIDSLRAATRGDPRQAERVGRLNNLAATRIQVMEAGIDARRKGGIEGGRAWVAADRGRQIMEQVDQVLNEIKSEEEKLSYGQDQAARKSAMVAMLLIVAGTASALLFLLVSRRVIRRDIHRRADMEQALRAARDELEHRVDERTAELQAVIETSPLAIAAMDNAGNITIWNTAAERLFGYTRDEMIGKPYRPLDKEDEASYLEIMRRVTAGQPVVGYEVQRRRKDGTPVDVAIYSAPLQDRNRSLGVLGVIADLTEQKRLHDRLRQSQKMEAIGKLAGGIAHDFNNLLTAITGYTDLLYLRLPGEIGKRELSEIRKSADRAASLTRQLLAFSRQQMLQPKIINVNDVLSNLSSMLGRLIGEDIELCASLDEDVGPVKADPFQLEQVIMNLAVNARDAMPRGGKLTIETANVDIDPGYARTHPDVAPGPYVMIAVSDTGIGMDTETRGRIFEPFFTTKELGKGTGLGLSTVYGIVKQSHGHMWVYSEPGQGATFKVYLPRTVADSEAPPDAAVPPAPTSKRGSETVLIVEDEASLLHLVAEIMQDSGYNVLPAHGPKDALRVLHEHPQEIHLLLTDVVMPGMSGRALADQVLAERPGTRVLYMSGYTDNAIVHHGVLDAGVTYIQKPFTPDTLTRKVREVLDTTQVSA
jgi:PAS domain S-box-containing protein